MKKIEKNRSWPIFLVTVFCGFSSFLVSGAQAATTTSYRSGLNTLGKNLGLQSDANFLIGNIIIGILSLLGVVALILIIYAGFLWLISQGDPTKVTKAKSIMIYAFIGLAIILGSYAISHYVIFNVLLTS